MSLAGGKTSHMRTRPPQLPRSSPEPPDKSRLPPFPAVAVPPLSARALPVPPVSAPAVRCPALPVPMVPGPRRPDRRPDRLPLRPPPPGRERPLPDAVALPSRLPLPAAGPSFDDQVGPDLAPLPAPLRAALPATGPGRAHSRPGSPADRPGPAGGTSSPKPAGAERDGTPSAAGAGAAPAREPGGGEWASQFAQALAEALAGSRPSRQIAPWTTEHARRRIRQLGPLLQAGSRPVVRRVLTSAPCAGVVEMTVIVGVGTRTRAIAVRLERARRDPAGPARPRGWVCTVIEAA